MRQPGVVALALTTVMLLGACGDGDSSSSQPSATSTARSDSEIEAVVEELWDGYEAAIATASSARLAEVTTGPALAAKTAYWVEYCPGYCPPPPAPAAGPPAVDVFGTSADGGSAVALLITTSNWVKRAAPLAALVRVDGLDRDGGARFSLLQDWFPQVEVPQLPHGTVAPLRSSGLRLAQEYFDLVDTMAETGRYPNDAPFQRGPYTDGYLANLATHREPEPWEVDTEDRAPATGADAVGFIVHEQDGTLHCGVDRWTSTTRHREGKAMRPEDALGDYGHLLDDDLYTSFTVNGFSTVCIIESRDEPPAVVTFEPERTTVTGTRSA